MQRLIMTTILAILLSGCGYFVSTTGAEIPRDSQAPDFELTDQEGRSVSLDEENADGPVVVEFYRGEFCSLARGRIKRLQRKLHSELERRGVALVAISTDKPDTVRSMAEETDVAFPLLSDPRAEVVSAYGVTMEGDWEGRKIAVPATFVIDASGQVTWAHVGDSAGDFARPAKIRKALEETAGEPD